MVRRPSQPEPSTPSMRHLLLRTAPEPTPVKQLATLSTLATFVLVVGIVPVSLVSLKKRARSELCWDATSRARVLLIHIVDRVVCRWCIGACLMIGFARDLKRLSRLVIQNGPRHAVGMGLYSIRARLMRFFDRAWEQTEGMHFDHKHVPLATLTVASPNKRHGFSYVPCTAIAVRAQLANIPADFSDFCFIDFGSGEGRSLVVASTYPFDEIIGVEFAKELHDAATPNLQKANSAAVQSGKLRSVHMDATQFEIPRRKCVLYFYNPFEQAVMRHVLLNIEQAYRECGAEMFIVFHQTRAALETNHTNNASLLRDASFLTECPVRIPSMLTRFLMGSQDYYLFRTITPTAGVTSSEFFDPCAPSLLASSTT